MMSERADFAPSRFSTAALPAAERVERWRDFARNVVCVEIEPLSHAPFECAATLRSLPELRCVSWAGSAARFERTPKIVSKGADTFGLVINFDGSMTALQRDREISLGIGDAALMLHSEPAALVQSHGGGVCLVLPRAALTPLVSDVEDAAMRAIPLGNEALQLLTGYLTAMREGLVLARPDLRHLVASHIHDLVATAIGANRDGAAIASERGLPAARLAAIKADVTTHLGNADLTLAAVAARHKISPRSVQLLFESEGLTFSQFVLERRLARVHRMLGDPRHAGKTISAIALAAGFGDLSHFHRSFRRRYGATPSDVRAAGGRQMP
jgi:AraC-like DNA-binding protein